MSCIDPVCGMTVDPARAAAHAEHDGKDYYFCCRSCRDRFVADPALYLQGRVSDPLWRTDIRVTIRQRRH